MIEKIMTVLGAGIDANMLHKFITGGGGGSYKDNHTKKTTAGRARSNRPSDSTFYSGEPYGNKLARKLARGVATKINY